MRSDRDVALDRDVARVTRELVRLDALAGRRRFRIWLRRGLRGLFGAGATLFALIKLKVAASLTIKLGLALVVGLGFVWPALGLAALVLATVVISLVTCENEVCDCPCDCTRKERRRDRLDDLAKQRRDWLASRSGRAPSLRRDALDTGARLRA